MSKIYGRIPVLEAIKSDANIQIHTNDTDNTDSVSS